MSIRPSKPRKQKRNSTGQFKAKYKPEYCQLLIKQMSQGHSFSYFCSQLGISRETGYRWVQAKDDFFEAKQIADTAYYTWWQELGRAGAAGQIQNFGNAAWIFKMKNTFNWTDKQEITASLERKQLEELPDEKILEIAFKAIERKSAQQNANPIPKLQQ